MLNFSRSDGSVGQSDRVMQTYANTLSIESAFVPGITRVNPSTDVCSVNTAFQFQENREYADLADETQGFVVSRVVSARFRRPGEYHVGDGTMMSPWR